MTASAGGPGASGGASPAPTGKEGSWDRPLRLIGYGLLGALLLTVAYYVRPGMPLGEKALYLAVSAAVGAVVMRLSAGWKYFGLLVVGVLLVSYPVQALLLERPVPVLFLLGYFLGMAVVPIDVAKRDARRAR